MLSPLLCPSDDFAWRGVHKAWEIYNEAPTGINITDIDFHEVSTRTPSLLASLFLRMSKRLVLAGAIALLTSSLEVQARAFTVYIFPFTYGLQLSLHSRNMGRSVCPRQ